MQPPRKAPKADDKLSLNVAGALHDCLAFDVVIVNDRQRITFCTPECERLLRLKPGATRQGRAALLPAPLQKLVREVAATNLAVTSRAILLSPRSRNPTVLQAGAIPVQLSSRARAVVIVLHDFTAARKVDQNVHQLDRLASLGVLSAGMAHEVKNALVSVKTFVDLLLEKNQAAELAEVVRREMRRIDSIIGQMLKYVGPGRATFSPVRVHEVLDHSLRMVQPQIQGRLISLNRAFNASPDTVKGDDYQLEQVFVNLLLNAIEAMGSNGSLTIATDLVIAPPARQQTARTNGAQVRIAIVDTGVGISTENMNRLFEPFFTTKQQGTGLGLAIARRIVGEHQGNISVQSQPNQGTTFNILLPASATVR